MTNFIPIFPLDIVVYPQESLNLHIFEPRYKQMIQECLLEPKPFGIVPVKETQVQEFGTLIQVVTIEKTYENGEMDIITQGQRVFRILEMIREVPNKLYSGAIVTYPVGLEGGKLVLMGEILRHIRELHGYLKVSKNFKKPDDLVTSFDVAHDAGLSFLEEYELLCLPDEIQRQQYLKRHLIRALSMTREMEHLKERIQLNGHFRNLSIDSF
ncbi:MAG: LON peptidase substrate-binding domain-containing protein [Chitinophagaceae bacterium]